jgi:hypothetical protein
MSKKLTPWFPGDVKPFRVGVYERDWNPSFEGQAIYLDFWDGESWWQYSVTRQRACERFRKQYQFFRWRGLTKEAK